MRAKEALPEAKNGPKNTEEESGCAKAVAALAKSAVLTILASPLNHLDRYQGGTSELDVVGRLKSFTNA